MTGYFTVPLVKGTVIERLFEPFNNRSNRSLTVRLKNGAALASVERSGKMNGAVRPGTNGAVKRTERFGP